GGACAMTSRTVYDIVGGFPQFKDKSFFLEDAAYINRLERHGYGKAILADLRVHHTGGEYNGGSAEKDRYWREYWDAAKRRNDRKRLLLKIPFVPALNERFGFFGPLEWEMEREPGGS